MKGHGAIGKWTAVVMLVAGVLGFGVPGNAFGNLLTNGGFESPAVPYNTSPYGSPTGWEARDTTRTVVSNGDGIGGSQCVAMCGMGGPNGNVNRYITQNTGVQMLDPIHLYAGKRWKIYWSLNVYPGRSGVDLLG
jgi:hypothetical protein